MVRFSLRRKLMFLSALIAVIPLVFAGQSLIRIARDEMKSAANDQLVTTSRQIMNEIDDIYQRAWLAPLLLVRNAVDGQELGVQEKIAILTHGITNLPDIVALQVSIEGSKVPLVVTQQQFSQRLSHASLVPLSVLRVDPASLLQPAEGAGEASLATVAGAGAIKPEATARSREHLAGLTYVPQTDDWLATIALPLYSTFGGGRAVLSARIDLRRIRTYIDQQPFRANGSITVVDSGGQQIFDAERHDLKDRDIVRKALDALTTDARVISVNSYPRPDGTVMLGAFSFVWPFDWTILVEKPEGVAYYAVDEMIRNLGVWLIAGLAIALAGAVLFSVGISKPILAIGKAVTEVGKGNFQARVKGVASRDEIGDLAARIDAMIVQINERFQLAKFVSSGTIAAIRSSDQEGVKLGGERREVTILFADIRGYTSFAETRDPETVVEVLNYYLQHQADLVAAHNGDIDKFVGDQIMAVFAGPRMAVDAVACAVDIQDRMLALARDHPDWQLSIGIGIDAGEVVMGAVGSKDRMDFTVLGDHVNLAARLCSSAHGKQTLISHAVAEKVRAASSTAFELKSLEPINVKGKSQPIRVYEAVRARGATAA